VLFPISIGQWWTILSWHAQLTTPSAFGISELGSAFERLLTSLHYWRAFFIRLTTTLLLYVLHWCVVSLTFQTSTGGGYLAFYNFSTGKEIMSIFVGETRQVKSMTFSDSGQMLYAGCNNGDIIWYECTNPGMFTQFQFKVCRFLVLLIWCY
jgi:hypothetical protein